MHRLDSAAKKFLLFNSVQTNFLIVRAGLDSPLDTIRVLQVEYMVIFEFVRRMKTTIYSIRITYI